MQEITQNMIDQAKENLNACYANGEIVPVYFNQQKLRLVFMLLNKNKTFSFFTVPFSNTNAGNMQEYILSLTEEYDILHIIRCFESIAYKLYGPIIK